MKKSQIILGGSAFILAIAGAFTTRANYKAVLVSAGVTINGVCHFSQRLTGVTNIKPNTNPVTARTTGGSTLYSVSGHNFNAKICHKQLWVKAST